MDTIERVFYVFKNLNPRINYVETINHIDDNIRDNYKPWTILMCACENKYEDIVKRCIALGADVNKVDIIGDPPLYLALRYHHPSYDTCFNIAELLLKTGANPNVKINRIMHIPILFYLHTSTETTKLLLKYGALTNEFYNYKEFIEPELQMYFIKVLAKRRWVVIKCMTLILSLHKRAVERANHPDRLQQQGVFEELE